MKSFESTSNKRRPRNMTLTPHVHTPRPSDHKECAFLALNAWSEPSDFDDTLTHAVKEHAKPAPCIPNAKSLDELSPLTEKFLGLSMRDNQHMQDSLSELMARKVPLNPTIPRSLSAADALNRVASCRGSTTGSESMSHVSSQSLCTSASLWTKSPKSIPIDSRTTSRSESTYGVLVDFDETDDDSLSREIKNMGKK